MDAASSQRRLYAYLRQQHNVAGQHIAAAALHLDKARLEFLDTASATPPGFSAALNAPFIRCMVMGGHDVIGWNA